MTAILSALRLRPSHAYSVLPRYLLLCRPRVSIQSLILRLIQLPPALSCIQGTLLSLQVAAAASDQLPSLRPVSWPCRLSHVQHSAISAFWFRLHTAPAPTFTVPVLVFSRSKLSHRDPGHFGVVRPIRTTAAATGRRILLRRCHHP